jgi:hypothetical protein
MENSKLITRNEYMKNSSELHHVYYLQFATKSTESFILNSLTVEGIKEAFNNGDKNLNNIKIPYNHMGRGLGWWWDDAPINVSLLKDLGESNSPSTHTCVAKAAAKMLTENKK